MTNDEFPMTKQIQNPNDQSQRAAAIRTFVLGDSFGIRPSDFVIFRASSRRLLRANRQPEAPIAACSCQALDHHRPAMLSRWVFMILWLAAYPGVAATFTVTVKAVSADNKPVAKA